MYVTCIIPACKEGNKGLTFIGLTMKNEVNHGGEYTVTATATLSYPFPPFFNG